MDSWESIRLNHRASSQRSFPHLPPLHAAAVLSRECIRSAVCTGARERNGGCGRPEDSVHFIQSAISTNHHRSCDTHRRAPALPATALSIFRRSRGSVSRDGAAPASDVSSPSCSNLFQCRSSCRRETVLLETTARPLRQRHLDESLLERRTKVIRSERCAMAHRESFAYLLR